MEIWYYIFDLQFIFIYFYLFFSNSWRYCISCPSKKHGKIHKNHTNSCLIWNLRSICELFVSSQTFNLFVCAKNIVSSLEKNCSWNLFKHISFKYEQIKKKKFVFESCLYTYQIKINHIKHFFFCPWLKIMPFKWILTCGKIVIVVLHNSVIFPVS